VDIDGELVIDAAATSLKTFVVDHLEEISQFCGVDIFLLGPKFNAVAPGLSSTGDAGQDKRWRVAIYGDMESAEHAKTRALIFIDRLVSISSIDTSSWTS
jgi:hypothetical protein